MPPPQLYPGGKHQQISLPGINEMFPEYLRRPSSTTTFGHTGKAPPGNIYIHNSMHNRQPSPPYSTLPPTSRNGFPTSPRPSLADSIPPRFAQTSSALPPSSNHVQSPHSHGSLIHQRPTTSSAFHPYKYAGDTPSLASTSVTDTKSETRATCFFDVLRSNPSTSSLEHIASSNSIRGHSSIKEEQDVALGMSSGAMPVFRVAMPGTPASSEPRQNQERGRAETPTQRLPTSHRFPSPDPRVRGAKRSAHVVPSSRPQAIDVPAIISFPLLGSPASVVSLARGGRKSNKTSEDGGDGGVHSHGERGKKHECHHCKKRFNRPSSLRIHVNTHTGAKPFHCPFKNCGRQFNVNSNMRRHYRNHVRAGLLPSVLYSPTGTSDDSTMPSMQWSSSEDDLTESDYDMEASEGAKLSEDCDEDDLEEDELDWHHMDERTTACAEPTLSSSSPSSPSFQQAQSRRNHHIHPPSLSSIDTSCSRGPSPLSSTSFPSHSIRHHNVRIPLIPIRSRNVS